MNGDAGSAQRADAARIIAAVLGEGRSLKAVLAEHLPGWRDPRDRALVEAMCFEAIRHRRRYEHALSAWLTRPLPTRESAVRALLLAGLAQLDALRLPAHAAVAATAGAARGLGRAAMVGLVNAVLRRAVREPWPVSDDPAVATSHPDWLVAAMRADWPDQTPAILAANNRSAPLWLRANPRIGDATALASALAAQGVDAARVDALPQALRLDMPVPVERIPGWAAGAASVQDGAAQLAVLALDPRPGERVLDACAAPGGKAAQIAEALGGRGRLVAMDSDARRLARLSATLARLGLDPAGIVLRTGDAASGVDGAPFDAILLDAPCSATGIIRRQPDVKWHRRAQDLPALAAAQARLLDALWPHLRPGGRLVYATCSVLRDENERQIAAFLARTADARAEPLDARFGRVSGAGRQRLPGEDGMDGFFYARLARAG